MADWLAKQTSEVFLWVGTLSNLVVPLEKMFLVLKARILGDHLYPRLLSSWGRFRPSLPCPEAPCCPAPT